MMRRSRIGAALLLGLGVLPGVGSAGEICLTDGQVLRGEVESQDDGVRLQIASHWLYAPRTSITRWCPHTLQVTVNLYGARAHELVDGQVLYGRPQEVGGGPAGAHPGRGLG